MMNDLINRQAAIDAIERNTYRHTYLEQIVDIVNALPSANVVEVVRCKDCKHNHCELVAGEECWLCGLGHEGHKIDRQDFYCADGERREA